MDRSELVSTASAMKPATVVNVRGKKVGVDYDVYVGRAMRGVYAGRLTLPGGATLPPGYFGSPFRVQFGDVEAAVAAYTQHFNDRIQREPEFRANVGRLSGLRLGCWCVDEKGAGPCHAQVLAAYLNGNAVQTAGSPR